MPLHILVDGKIILTNKDLKLKENK